MEITQIILRYLTDDCTEKELSALREWAQENTRNAEWLSALKTLWQQRTVAQLSEQSYLDAQFAQVMEKIAANEQAKTPAISAPSAAPFARKRYTWWAVAASVAVLVSFFALKKPLQGFFSASEQYLVVGSAQSDSVTRFLLPDSSIVWLAAHSEIKYTPRFGTKERRVLLDGEAYFDVKKDAGKPFRVQTADFTVKVLGTRFNVSSHKDNATTDATLISGKIVIENKNAEELLVMQPGQKIVYSKQNRYFAIEDVKPSENTVALRNNYVAFTNASLRDVMRRLEQIYGTPIEITSDKFRGTYTGSIQCKDSLETVLRGLQNVIHFSFRKEEHKIVVESR